MNTFGVRTRIFMGKCDLAHIYENVGRAFIVTDKFMAESGRVSYVTDQLEAAGIEYRVFSDIAPDPDISMITAGIEQIKEFQPDVVFGFGGGSPMDAAKSIIFFAEKAYDIKDCKLIAIPTTSGTGSEVTKFAVISDREKGAKYPIIDAKLLPNAVVLDASLVLSVPQKVTVDTGMDVLVHGIEAFVSTNANDFSDADAEKAIRMVRRFLPRVYKDPNDIEARQVMHNASCLAGLAFNNASLGITHSMAHILGARAHIAHGRANAILLPYVIEFNAGVSRGKNAPNAAAERYADIAHIMHIDSASTRQSVINLLKYIKKFEADLGVEPTIAAAGVDETFFKANVDEMAEIALDDSCTKTNPTPCTAKDIRELFMKAYYGH